jgi:dienelactone hydrolase
MNQYKAKLIKPLIISVLISYFAVGSHAQVPEPPDTVAVSSGNLLLKGLLWHPVGTGVFPAVIFCHGSYETNGLRYDVVQQTSVLGQLFARNGYVFLGLFRQGAGLSKNQGKNSADLMSKALKEKGQQERNKVQMQQLQTNDLQDISSGLAFLRQRKDVDSNSIAVIGHSFGGSLALLVTEHDPGIRAVVVFGAAGFSWNGSPQLRIRLIEAIKKINVPVMLVYAQNDYSLNPAYSLDSAMTLWGKQHLLKIYPSYGNSSTEGHNIVFLKGDLWKTDVFNFLRQSLYR